MAHTWLHGDYGCLDVLLLLFGVRLPLPTVLLGATHLVVFQRNLVRKVPLTMRIFKTKKNPYLGNRFFLKHYIHLTRYFKIHITYLGCSLEGCNAHWDRTQDC